MTPATVAAVVVLCALTTLLVKGIGPLAAGSRDLPAPAVRVVVLLAPALLAALVVTSALADGDRLRLGADTAGAVAAALLLWSGAHLLLAVVAAAGVTAALRAAGLN